ncbi:hypothetical protein HK16_11290 [Acetobacter senegalensis]|uniref:Uncharacterized protein n=2 Tax=Acetobacter TaxID=434 RepID=A0A252EI85_9PROT|nr:hypothetical protein CIW82_10530 [Acetobacter tropicalis]OUL66201.1 hypothetical protein HK16_11290 [Acetobacter senegalensis]
MKDIRPLHAALFFCAPVQARIYPEWCVSRALRAFIRPFIQAGGMVFCGVSGAILFFRLPYSANLLMLLLDESSAKRDRPYP